MHLTIIFFSDQQVTCTRIDQKTGVGTETRMTLNFVCEVFMGCPGIPLDALGMIKFDHQAFGFPYIATCGPVITFLDVKKLQLYDTFQDQMVEALVSSANYFGTS